MKFNDLLKQHGLYTEEQRTSPRKLIKIQKSINESFLAAAGEDRVLAKQISDLNSLYDTLVLEESALISHNKNELLMLIDDLLDMINNPDIKLSRNQLIQKLQGYREQLRTLEQ